VLLEKFGIHLVFELNLGFESLDFFVFQVVEFGLSSGPSEFGVRVFEELFLPLVNLCRL